MSSLATSGVVFAVIFGGALLGMALRKLLPEHHREPDTKDVVKLGMGIVGTMAALVLGLLTASAKSSFDSQHTVVAQLAANVSLLDRALAHYGPEAKSSRDELRTAVTAMIDHLWPEQRGRSAQVEPNTSSEELFEQIQRLAPKSEAQRTLQATALKTTVDIAQERRLLAAQKSNSIQPPFLVVVTFWFAALFASFSLFSRPNATMVLSLLVAALSIAGAIFLILEMDQPFDGLIRLSSDPLRRALTQLGR
jgi:hypothetical protein